MHINAINFNHLLHGYNSCEITITRKHNVEKNIFKTVALTIHKVIYLNNNDDYSNLDVTHHLYLTTIATVYMM